MGEAEVGAGEPPVDETETTDEPDQTEASEIEGVQPAAEAASSNGHEPAVVTEPEPEPEPEEPAEPAPDPVLTRLDELHAAIERVDGRIAERDRLAARDRDLLDKLHAENQRLRAGEAFAVIAPMVRDLIRLRDQLLQLDAASPEPGRSDAALIEPQLLGILARVGVEPYEPAEGDTFDAHLHQGVGRITTEDAALDGKVAAVRRAGFTAPDGRPLRAAEVEVWHHVPNDPEPAGGS